MGYDFDIYIQSGHRSATVNTPDGRDVHKWSELDEDTAPRLVLTALKQAMEAT